MNEFTSRVRARKVVALLVDRVPILYPRSLSRNQRYLYHCTLAELHAGITDETSNQIKPAFRPICHISNTSAFVFALCVCIDEGMRAHADPRALDLSMVMLIESIDFC
jgi:hypothetical protein